MLSSNLLYQDNSFHHNYLLMLPEELQYHNTEMNTSKGAKLNTLKVLTVLISPGFWASLKLELSHDLGIFLKALMFLKGENTPQGRRAEAPSPSNQELPVNTAAPRNSDLPATQMLLQFRTNYQQILK